jgi:hypothetical protein
MTLGIFAKRGDYAPDDCHPPDCFIFGKTRYRKKVAAEFEVWGSAFRRFEGRVNAELRTGAVSKSLWPPRRFRANELRVSVVDCGSPSAARQNAPARRRLPLCVARLPVKKRQRTAAVQNLAESSGRLSDAATVFVKPL